MSGWDPKYGSGPLTVMVPCARCESLGWGEGCVVHMERYGDSKAVSTVNRSVLTARGERALPSWCPGVEGFVRCVGYGRLSSHNLRRRAEFIGPVVTRCLQRADGARKSCIYIRPLWL